jgi:hypothetical protein
MAQKNNKNAFKFGVYANQILLPNESAEEFKQHLQEFRLQFNPVGEPQEAVVREMATIQWVKNRLNAPLRQCFLHSEVIVSEIGESPREIIVRSLKASMALLTAMNDAALSRGDKVLRVASDLLSVAQNPLRHNVDAVLKLHEQLDRHYDKCIKRLVTMKEYDRLYGAKRIEQLPKAEPTLIAPNETAGDTRHQLK